MIGALKDAGDRCWTDPIYSLKPCNLLRLAKVALKVDGVLPRQHMHAYTLLLWPNMQNPFIAENAFKAFFE